MLCFFLVFLKGFCIAENFWPQVLGDALFWLFFCAFTVGDLGEELGGWEVPQEGVCYFWDPK